MTAKVRPNSLLTSLFLMGFVATLYFSTGLLGLQLAVPPSQAGAVWPPAGIALASMLYFGPRIWPGIFIGNFFISAWAFGFDNTSLSIYLATGTGATLCAYVGYRLIQFYVGINDDLIQDGKIIMFLLLGGPVSCLIPASIGISSMFLSGIIDGPELLVNWASWWIGDTIGVLIFTPLILTLLHRDKPVWKRRRIVLILPMLGTLALVILVFLFIQNQEYDRQVQHFKAQAKIATDLFDSRFQTHIRNMETLHGFFVESDDPLDDEFRSFSKLSLRRFSEIKLIRWLKNQPDNKMVVQFIESKDSHSESKDYLLPEEVLAEFSNHLFFSANSYSYLRPNSEILDLYLPVYKNDNNPGSLFGVLTVSLDIREMAKNLLQTEFFDNLFLTVTDVVSGRDVFNNLDEKTRLDHIDQYQSTTANHTWRLHYGIELHLDNKTHWALWWVIISGLLFVSMMGGGLLILTGRYFETENIVNKRTSELLKAKNYAESANNAKTKFISNISHELRTPLNGILGFTELLQKKAYVNEEDRKKLNIISHCGQHLLNLIDDLLDISRIESNKIVITKNLFDLNAFLDEIYLVFKVCAENKNLNLVLNKDHTLSYIIADKKRLHQILVNLLNNAIKFTKRGYISLSVFNQQDKLVFIVEDTGCGISDKDQQRIFKHFVQIENNGFSAEGIGLGLAISMELVHLMQGTLQVSSQLQKGSQFRVTIPLEQADDPGYLTGNDDITDLHATEGTRVLVADDNEINLLLFSHLLDEINCQHDIADDGGKAWAMLQNKQYHFALIDLNMPGMSGLQLIEKIKQQGMILTTIAVSAYADENIIKTAIQAGFDHYLTKPVNAQSLKTIITQHIKTTAEKNV
jgi:signal transduction histidine kinase/CheY-like chemotaxis protein